MDQEGDTYVKEEGNAHMLNSIKLWSQSNKILSKKSGGLENEKLNAQNEEEDDDDDDDLDLKDDGQSKIREHEGLIRKKKQ